jgi:hypothetical protein
MTEFIDTRSSAEKVADLELSQARCELMEWGDELNREGLTEREIVGLFCSNLEERLARLYRDYYELSVT